MTISEHGGLSVPRRLVHRARFQNEVVAEAFAEACRREGMKAFVGSIWAGNLLRRTGWQVQWAPTWEHFQHDC